MYRLLPFSLVSILAVMPLSVRPREISQQIPLPGPTTAVRLVQPLYQPETPLQQIVLTQLANLQAQEAQQAAARQAAVQAAQAAPQVEAAHQALAAVKAVAPAPPPPTATTTDSAYAGTGDAALDWIVSHESGGNPYAINASSGACGLFQALPCSKLGCALSNIQCQINWGRQYCLATYGSTANAMAFWKAHSWY